MLTKVKQYYAERPLELVFVVLIVVAAAFFRLYKIDQYMRFLGDEGRDALVVLHMVRDHHIPLIGPGTSVGNMYLGPWYYYMMFVPMALTKLNPVSAAAMVGVIGTVTVLFVYAACKDMFHSAVAGIIAAACYAVFYIPVTTSRSSWNPYPMPFFALATVYCLYRAIKSLNSWWLIIAAAAAALAINMHLMGVLLLPVVGIFWLVALYWYWTQKRSLAFFFFNSFLALLVFLLIISPLYFFDRRHDYINYKAFKAFLSDRQTSVNLNPLNTIGKLWQTYSDLYVDRLLTYSYPMIGAILSIVIALAAVAEVVWMTMRRRFSLGFAMTLVWLGVGVVGMTLIKTHVYDHYFGFLYPAIFLLVGLLLGELWRLHPFAKYIVIALTVVFIGINLIYNPLSDKPGRQLQRTQNVARYIIGQTQGQKYNFALISRSNYFDAYEFYLTLWNDPFTAIDPEHFQQTIADKLYVVCEDPVCEPLNNDRAEISRFGWAKIDSEVQVNDVKVFVLSHTVPPIASASAKL